MEILIAVLISAAVFFPAGMWVQKRFGTQASADFEAIRAELQKIKAALGK